MKHSNITFSAIHAVFCAAVLFAVQGQPLLAQQPPQPPPPSQALTANQLDDLVAPIALYPDPLLSQILVASTYPLEIVEVSQWLQRNPGLTGAALTQAAEQQNWDPSIQALVVFPDLVKRLNQDITWTFRVLKSQGPDAAGGAFDYVVKGKMIGGFALVAFPAEDGVSGIRTLIINPDKSWQRVDLE